MADAFTRASYGARKVGYGARPAILVVDFQRGYTDPNFTMGRSERIHTARDRTVPLLQAARQAGIPVSSILSHNDLFHVTTAEPLRTNGFHKELEQTLMDLNSG